MIDDNVPKRMRTEPLKRRLVRIFSAGGLASTSNWDLVERLPVPARATSRKRRLVRELREIDRQSDALSQRVRRAGAALEKLPIVNTLISR